MERLLYTQLVASSNKKDFNMDERIIYPNEFGNVAVLTPTGVYTVEETARKDVPEGVPYRIVSKDDLPSDMEFFGAWEADFSNPDGVGIGHKKWFAERGIEV